MSVTRPKRNHEKALFALCKAIVSPHAHLELLRAYAYSFHPELRMEEEE
jgi:hypothetical protein|tara:strand:- start:1455 stop:1601 length:147 start_codon:yes stop_codon:yes gene_type:complete